MKLFYLACCILLFSCGKEKDVTPASGPGVIEYRVNGEQVKITNTSKDEFPVSIVSGRKFNAAGFGQGYQIAATYAVDTTGNLNEQNKQIVLQLMLDSVTAGKEYTSASDDINLQIIHKKLFYTAHKNINNTLFSITITDYHDGLMSGTFSADTEVLMPDNTFVYTTVTDGKFTNVQITYR